MILPRECALYVSDPPIRVSASRARESDHHRQDAEAPISFEFDFSTDIEKQISMVLHGAYSLEEQALADERAHAPAR